MGECELKDTFRSLTIESFWENLDFIFVLCFWHTKLVISFDAPINCEEVLGRKKENFG